jgi:hypothetical protein
MLKKYIATTLIITILLAPLINASNTGLLYDTMKNGNGVCPLSMGHAFTAVAKGANSIFYNPAGLANPGGEYRYETLDMKENIYNNSNTNMLYISPFGYSNQRKETNDNDFVEVNTFSYGTKGSKGIDWGISYKNIKSSIDNNEKNSWSSDIGLLIHFSSNFNLGFTAKDILKENLEVPTTYIFGTAFSAKDFIIATDIVSCKDTSGKQSYTSHSGIKYKITEGLIAMGGMYQQTISGGLTIKLPFVEINYGVIRSTIDNNNVLYMLGIKIGKGPFQNKKRRRY